MRALRARLTYANVMASIALFVALGGTSIAALRIGSRQIVDNSVRSRDLRDNDVRGRDVRNGSLTGRDLRRNSIGPAQVAGLLATDFAPGQLPDPLPATLPSRRTLRGVFADPAEAPVLWFREGIRSAVESHERPAGWGTHDG